MPDNTEVVVDFVRDLSRSHYWGALTLRFENGQIVHLVKEQGLKPQDLSPSQSRTYASANSNK